MGLIPLAQRTIMVKLATMPHATARLRALEPRPAISKVLPILAHISTSYVERQNLSMCMGMRRFTRLTNGFSKKAENHAYAVALHYMHYNFGRIHKTLRVTPAMEAGVTDHLWTMEEIAALMDANYVPFSRGSYKKKIQTENSK